MGGEVQTVFECINSLNELWKHNNLNFCLVSGHVGNERADCLANRCGRRLFIGPESITNLSTHGSRLILLEKGEHRLLIGLFTGYCGLRYLKFTIPRYADFAKLMTNLLNFYFAPVLRTARRKFFGGIW